MTVFEVIGDYASIIKDPEVMTEYVRSSLRMEISRKHATDSGDLYVITLLPTLESQLIDSLHKSEMTTTLLVDPAIKGELVNRLAKALGKAGESGITPSLLVSSNLRLYLRKCIEKELPTLPILSYNEISDSVVVHSLEVVSLGKDIPVPPMLKSRK